MRKVLLLLLSLFFASAQASVSVPVFVLHSYSQEYPWTKGQHQGFVDALNSDPSRTYDIETAYLDTMRVVFSPAYADMMARFLKEKYKGYKPAAIYVTDDNALIFALYRLDKMFPGVPVFFSGVNDYNVKADLDPARVTGVFEKKEIAPNLALMKRIDPAVRDIVVVGDASKTHVSIEVDIRREMAHYPEIRATYISNDRIDNLVRELKKRKERFVFLTTLGAVKDREGHTLTLAETISTIVNAGHFEVFSMEDAYLFPGVLGGYVTSGRLQGKSAARMLLRYLDGTPVSALAPVEASPNEYILDEMELTKAGFSIPRDLKGPVTLVHPIPSYYESHRPVILGTIYSLVSLLLISLAISLYLVIRKNLQVAKVREVEAKIIESQRQLSALMGNLQGMVYRCLNDRDWTLEFVSDGCLELTGYPAEDFVVHRTVTYGENVIHPDDQQLVWDAVQAAIAEKRPFVITYRILTADKKEKWVWEHGSGVYGENGELQALEGFVTDITERKQAEWSLQEKDADLKYFAYHDVLTDLPNRALLTERMAHAANRADRTGNMLALLFIDLDRFKTINDSLGHIVGDALLKATALRLKKLIRKVDTVARFGGDEFVILLEDVLDSKNVVVVVQKILRELDSVFEIDGHHLHTSGSIGISLYPQDGRDADTLIKNADAAMYKAKERGRNNFYFYEKALTDLMTQRVHMETKLRTAFEREALELYYQPLVILESRRICGVEALLRWNDPEEGMISPDHFIPLAEETGLIIPVGDWVVRQACLSL